MSTFTKYYSTLNWRFELEVQKEYIVKQGKGKKGTEIEERKATTICRRHYSLQRSLANH